MSAISTESNPAHRPLQITLLTQCRPVIYPTRHNRVSMPQWKSREITTNRCRRARYIYIYEDTLPYRLSKKTNFYSLKQVPDCSFQKKRSAPFFCGSPQRLLCLVTKRLQRNLLSRDFSFFHPPFLFFFFSFHIILFI